MNRDHYLAISGGDYIRAMFANTQNRVLTMEDQESFQPDVYVLDWDQEKMENTVARFEKLQGALTRLGKDHAHWETATDALPQELLEVWNTYIRPYPDHGMDQEKLFDLSMREEFGEQMTEEEQEMLDRQRDWMKINALTRLPYDRCNPASMIQRARRYEKLVSLKAPRLIQENEARALAEQLVLYTCRVK